MKFFPEFINSLFLLYQFIVLNVSIFKSGVKVDGKEHVVCIILCSLESEKLIVIKSFFVIESEYPHIESPNEINFTENFLS